MIDKNLNKIICMRGCVHTCKYTSKFVSMCLCVCKHACVHMCTPHTDSHSKKSHKVSITHLFIWGQHAITNYDQNKMAKHIHTGPEW